MEGFSGFLLAALALAGSPGPATLSLAAAGAAFGLRHSVGYLAGIVLGMVAVMAITASGVIGLLLALPAVTPAVTAIAAIYFLWLAFRIAMAPPLGDLASTARPPRFAGGFGLSLINPKGYAAMVAFFSGFVLIRSSLILDLLAKTVTLSAVITAVNVLWLIAGTMLARWFRDPRLNRLVNVAFAILLLASVAIAVV